MPEWISQNIGTVLVVGGSVLVAVISGAFGLWAKHHTPKQPVPITDVWAENRALRDDLSEVNQRLDQLQEDFRTFREEKYTESRELKHGLEVLWAYVERIRAAWGTVTDMPTLTPAERRALAHVIEDLDTPGATINA